MRRTLILLTMALGSSLLVSLAGAFTARRAYKYDRPIKRRAILVLMGTVLLVLLVTISAFMLITMPPS
jgi:hypothetical protein